MALPQVRAIPRKVLKRNPNQKLRELPAKKVARVEQPIKVELITKAELLRQDQVQLQEQVHHLVLLPTKAVTKAAQEPALRVAPVPQEAELLIMKEAPAEQGPQEQEPLAQAAPEQRKAVQEPAGARATNLKVKAGLLIMKAEPVALAVLPIPTNILMKVL